MGRMLRKAKIYGLFVDEPNGNELLFKARNLVEVEHEALKVSHDWRAFISYSGIKFDVLKLKIVELISGRTVARYIAGTPLK